MIPAAGAAALAMLAVVLTTFTSPLCDMAVAGEVLESNDVLLLPSAFGPECVAFDSAGGGPYTGVADGRVLRWEADGRRWDVFSIPPRPQEVSSEGCSGSFLSKQAQSICGRPLGLQFRRSTGELYVADAYYGLLAVGPAGGVASQVATGAEGEPFRFTNGLDVDQDEGAVYFTDSSRRFEFREFLLVTLTGDATGRLVRYDPKTAAATVLLRGLSFPNGVAVSRDNSFVLAAETAKCRLLRYWLRGAEAGTADVFAEIPGYPDKIRRNSRGEFWVAIAMGRLNWWGSCAHGAVGGAAVKCPVAARVGGDGRVLEVVEDCKAVGAVSEVREEGGALWAGSWVRPYIEVYKR